MKKFSVLMSVYFKENPEFLLKSLNSVINQTVKPDEIVLVKDGKLTPELDDAISKFSKKHSELFNIITLKQNVGLGRALAKGLQVCKNELIARMDTDDICIHNRFELQLREFDNDPKLDICGGYIEEFIDNENNIIGFRKVPLDQNDIYRYQKKRDAFNHMTVMYKKTAVLAAGNYQSCLLMEDSLLWSNMLIKNANCKNIANVLCKVRVGNEMYSRRGGWKYFIKYVLGRTKILKTGYISFFDYIETIFIQFFVAFAPLWGRKILFKYFLRSRR